MNQIKKLDQEISMAVFLEDKERIIKIKFFVLCSVALTRGFEPQTPGSAGGPKFLKNWWEIAYFR